MTPQEAIAALGGEEKVRGIFGKCIPGTHSDAMYTLMLAGIDAARSEPDEARIKLHWCPLPALFRGKEQPQAEAQPARRIGHLFETKNGEPKNPSCTVCGIPYDQRNSVPSCKALVQPAPDDELQRLVETARATLRGAYTDAAGIETVFKVVEALAKRAGAR